LPIDEGLASKIRTVQEQLRLLNRYLHQDKNAAPGEKNGNGRWRRRKIFGRLLVLRNIDYSDGEHGND
jgi:hypothetical protein